MIRLCLGALLVTSVGCGASAVRPAVLVGEDAAEPAAPCRTFAWPAHARFVAHSSEWPSVHQSFDALNLTVAMMEERREPYVVMVHGELSTCEHDPSLSTRRAASVARALVEHGFPPERVVIRADQSLLRASGHAKSEPDTCRPEDGLRNGEGRRAGVGVYLCLRPEVTPSDA